MMNDIKEHDEELDLIAGLKTGDQQAFKTVFEQNKDRVFNTAFGMVHNYVDAEEITQEVFITVLRSILQFKGDARLSTWIYRITVTRSLDFLKAAKRKKRLAFVMSLFGNEHTEGTIHAKTFEHPGVALEKREQAAALFGAMEQLPDKQKVAFTLQQLENLSCKEISEVLKTTVSSVESLLHRAKQNLRKILIKETIQEK